MCSVRCVALGIVALVVAGCASAGVDHALVGTTLANRAARRDFYEATLRTLDAHPDYVDEFFVASRSHPRTLRQFTNDFTRELYQPDLAGPTSDDLSRNPESLRVILERTIDASRHRPAARDAIARAVESRSVESSSMIADRPSAVAATARANIAAVQSRPAARAAFLAVMRAERDTIAAMIQSDPATRGAMISAMARAVIHPVALPTVENVPSDRGKQRARGGGPRR